MQKKSADSVASESSALHLRHHIREALHGLIIEGKESKCRERTLFSSVDASACLPPAKVLKLKHGNATIRQKKRLRGIYKLEASVNLFSLWEVRLKRLAVKGRNS